MTLIRALVYIITCIVVASNTNSVWLGIGAVILLAAIYGFLKGLVLGAYEEGRRSR